jgi:hypothetical protein
LQVLYPSLLCPCHFEKCLVTIDADNVPPRFHGPCDACSNRAGAAANVKHRKSRTQEFGKAAVISFESSPPK